MPRTLSFLIHGDQVLLLRGHSTKRLWADTLNGVGGHVEPGEDILQSARREVEEETGLPVDDLTMRGIIHIAGRGGAPGVLLFVLVGRAPSLEVRPGDEGDLEWHPIDRLPREDLMEDLPLLLPRVLAADPCRPVYGHYAVGEDGRMGFRFRQ